MSQPMTTNQVVAYNLTRIRKALGLTQEQAAERLEPYLGERWSKAVYSAAERSFHGKRVRNFTADDLTALALAFGVPVPFFFIPPRPEDRARVAEDAEFTSGGTPLQWPVLFDVMFGGENRTLTWQRAMIELPAGEHPTANSIAGVMIGQLQRPVSIWDREPGGQGLADAKVRMASTSVDDEGDGEP